MLVGGPGDDNLAGGPGNDELSGGEGEDLLGGQAGADDLIGGTGRDRLTYTTSSGGIRIALFSPALHTSRPDLRDGTLPDGQPFVFVGGPDDHFVSRVSGDRLAPDVEDVKGSPSDDRIFATDEFWPTPAGPTTDTAPHNIDGQGGDDLLVGSGGADTIRGGAGADILYGMGAPDLLEGGLGDDEVYAYDSGYTSPSPTGPCCDVVRATGDRDGNDRYRAGSPFDQFLVDRMPAIFDGSPRTDPMFISLYHQVEGPASFLGGQVVTYGPDGEVVERDSLKGFRGAYGGGGDDKIMGGDNPNILSGNGGDDVIYGLGGVDAINAGPGADIVGADDAVDPPWDVPGRNYDDGGGSPVLNPTPSQAAEQVFCGSGLDAVVLGAGDSRVSCETVLP